LIFILTCNTRRVNLLGKQKRMTWIGSSILLRRQSKTKSRVIRKSDRNRTFVHRSVKQLFFLSFNFVRSCPAHSMYRCTADTAVMAHNVTNKIGVKPAWYRVASRLNYIALYSIASCRCNSRCALPYEWAECNWQWDGCHQVRSTFVDIYWQNWWFCFSCYAEKNHEIVQECELWIICEISEIVKTKNNLQRCRMF